MLSELCRKLFGVSIRKEGTFAEQVRRSSEILVPHLSNLGSGTRSAEDWVTDVILQTWSSGKLIFSVSETIKTLMKDFSFYHSYPPLYLDGSFYKAASQEPEWANKAVIDHLDWLNLYLLDYRVPISSVLDPSLNFQGINETLDYLVSIFDEIAAGESYARLEDFLDALQQLLDHLPTGHKRTKAAISEFIEAFPQWVKNRKAFPPRFKEFESWWGRGQIYLSFLRRIDSDLMYDKDA